MIYCVEDDTNIREIEIYTLKSLGLEAEGFEDGKAFFTALENNVPDLVILDVMLPDLDGIEILKRLKSNHKTRDLPVIMATARGAEFEKVQALDIGADDYLAKPFSMIEMAARVKAVLRRCHKDTSSVITVDKLKINEESRTISVNDIEVDLTYKEFELLREYAHKNGVSLMGDIPFYVGLNSSDCWANQDNFMLDENDVPAFVAGVPPDYFSEDGQRWGNPVYDWEFLQDDNFDFWFQRLENANKLYDYIRIDHFRAFDTYYCIPFNDNTARNGFWKKAKGDEFFSLIESRNLDLKIFVEDLGDIIPSVELLRDKYHLIGMNVLEFDLFKRDIEIKQNQVLYTGTHDNNTLVGWYKELDEGKKTLLNIKMRYEKIDGKNFLDAILNFAFKSDAEYLIVPTQDYLGLDSYYRMNTPGTFGEPNWTFRIKSLDELKKKAPYIASLVNKYNR